MKDIFGACYGLLWNFFRFYVEAYTDYVYNFLSFSFRLQREDRKYKINLFATRNLIPLYTAFFDTYIGKILIYGQNQSFIWFYASFKQRLETRDEYIQQAESHSALCCISSELPCQVNIFVPPARKLVFPLQLTVAQCSILRYRGMKCKN